MSVEHSVPPAGVGHLFLAGADQVSPAFTTDSGSLTYLCHRLLHPHRCRSQHAVNVESGPGAALNPRLIGNNYRQHRLNRRDAAQQLLQPPAGSENVRIRKLNLLPTQTLPVGV